MSHAGDQPPSTYVVRALVGKRGALHVRLREPGSSGADAVEIRGLPEQVWSLSIDAKGPGGSFFATRDRGLSLSAWRVTARIGEPGAPSHLATTNGDGDCASG
jgi:hypothetical protein